MPEAIAEVFDWARGTLKAEVSLLSDGTYAWGVFETNTSRPPYHLLAGDCGEYETDPTRCLPNIVFVLESLYEYLKFGKRPPQKLHHGADVFFTDPPSTVEIRDCLEMLEQINQVLDKAGLRALIDITRHKLSGGDKD